MDDVVGCTTSWPGFAGAAPKKVGRTSTIFATIEREQGSSEPVWMRGEGDLQAQARENTGLTCCLRAYWMRKTGCWAGRFEHGLG